MARSKARLSLNITTILGLVLAAATFVLALGFLGTKDQTVTVYTASQDIAPKKAITADMVVSSSVATGAVPPGALLTPDAIVGRFTTDAVYQGEVFTDRRVSEQTTSSVDILTAQLGPDARLISISADVGAAVAGRIKTGDSVDVIAVVSDNALSTGVAGVGVPRGAFAQTIIQQAVVIDVNLPQDALRQAASDTGTNQAESGSAPVIPGIYTLAVTGKQAELLALADQNGTLYLTLTPTKTSVPVVGNPTTMDNLAAIGAAAPQTSK